MGLRVGTVPQKTRPASELNQFNGLPFSSRYYKVLKERKTLLVWRVRCKFEDALANNQMVVVSGAAQTGTSTQVKAAWRDPLFSALGGWGSNLC